ncbi:MAG: hypothetical protein AAGF95_32255 [Chloroflexota bacterium]
MKQQTCNWRSVVWSAALIFLIPHILYELIGLVYGIYVGFQVRGDSEMIAEGLAVLSASSLYQSLPYDFTAVVALWRGWVLSNILKALVAAVIVAALWFLLGMVFNDPLRVVLIEAGGTLSFTVGMCVLGTLLHWRRPVTA